jgi:cytochrome d ubiquinol oxidase subunit I
MLPTLLSVDFSRWQFAWTAMFHFIFVPLTLGLTWILFTMELMYVRTSKIVYKDMTKFWGKLLGINFAVGVLSGLTMEFEFGTNWAYYSQFVGDIFGTPLAIEGLAAFMLESTFVGLFFFGWDKLSKRQHLFATFCLAIGSSFSALLILVANGFMQVPAGGHFVWQTMRMETTNLGGLFLNEMAQVGFAHTILAGYTTAAIFVIGISAFYLLRRQDVDFAKRSMAIGLGFCLVVSLMLMFFGDQQGLTVYKTQPMKLSAIEAEWETNPAPANFNLIAFPSQSAHQNAMAVQLPEALGLLVTHNLHTQIYGIDDILYKGYVDANGNTVPSTLSRIQSGAIAYDAMMKMRAGDTSAKTVALYNAHQADLGYGMLLLQEMPANTALSKATPAQINTAALSTVPNVAGIFWSFRVMVAIGFLMFFTTLLGVIFTVRGSLWNKPSLLRVMVYSIPLPWIACLCGWFVTEHGRQPWTVYGMLPTNLSSSMINQWDVFMTVVIFMLFDIALLVLEMFLMFKFARKGPSSLHLGKYDLESK